MQIAITVGGLQASISERNGRACIGHGGDDYYTPQDLATTREIPVFNLVHGIKYDTDQDGSDPMAAVISGMLTQEQADQEERERLERVAQFRDLLHRFYEQGGEIDGYVWDRERCGYRRA